MYAIDFGTSNTVVSRWNRGTNRPETLRLGPLSAPDRPTVPSLLYLKKGGDCLIGQQVLDQGLDLPADPRFFRDFKRGIGAAVQGFVPQLDGVEVTFEQVGSYFLKGIFQQLLAQGETLDELVLTVPVNSFEAYRQWLANQVADWPCQKVQLLDESTAAALGYGAEQRECLLVFDFGGGTLDLSLIEPLKAPPQGFWLKWGRNERRPQTVRVLGKAGRTLGGCDIDQWLAQALAQQQRLPRSQRLQQAAERIKIQLSSQESYQEAFLDEENFTTYELGATRAQLKQLLTAHGFFTQLEQALSELTQQARQQGLRNQDIQGILAVGGTTQIPLVQQWLREQFPDTQIYLDRPFEAVAHGALRLGQGLQVEDYLYHSYGIRYWDHRQARHSWQPIFTQGSPYPSPSYELVLGASVSNQPSGELVVGELEEQRDSTEVYFDGTSLVTRIRPGTESKVRPLNDAETARTIARLDPPGFPGSDRIKATFQVDAQRTLRLTVLDLLTDRLLLDNQAVIELR